MAPTSLPGTPSLSMALVRVARPGTPPSWLLPAAKVRRRSNIGSSWASTNSTLAPWAVCQVWISRVRRVGALPSRAVSDCSLAASPVTALSDRLAQAPSARAVDRTRPSRPRRRCSVFMAGLLIAGLFGQNGGGTQAPVNQGGTGSLLAVGRGHGFQFGQFLIDQLPGQADGFQLADAGGLAGDRVALEYQAGDDLGAHSRQFVSRWRGFLQLLQLAPQTGLGLLQRPALLHVGRRREDEQAVATGEGVVPGAGAGHEFLAALQACGQACAVTTIEQGRGQAQGVDLAWRFAGGQARHVEAHDQIGQLGL